MSFSLKLLGGSTLMADDGPLAGAVVQRHRLALLAVLAVARPRAASRDKLMALLWPGRDPENARQLLNQAVHAVRRALSAEAVLSTGEELQLNSSVVECDAVAFEEALSANRLEEAAGLYRGPFLDGFFLDDAAEFERWVDRERERLAGLCGNALESLATAAEQSSDAGGAVAWWKRRAGLDPFDSRVALRLMQALERAGNRAGAMQHGRAHQQLLQDELEMEPDGEMLAAIERLRESPPLLERLAEVVTPRPVGSPAVRLPSPVQPLEPASRRPLIYTGSLLLAGVLLLGIVRLMAREGPTLTKPAVDEIAQAVARELTRRQQNDPGVVPRERRTTSIKAYELFLRGSDPAVLRSDSAARAALRHFQEAVALDSSYAAAWLGLGRMTYRVGGHRSRALTEAAVSRAIALDTTYAEAWAILGGHRTRARDFLTAERYFQRAIALEPNNGRIREIHANSLLLAWRPVEALAEAERAVALGPLAPSASAILAQALLLNDRCDEALARLEPLMALEPPPLRVAGLAATCHARKANWAGAIAVLERQAEREAKTRAVLGYMRARAGQRNQATEIQDGLLQLWRNGHLPAVWLAWVPAGLGERDSAFAWIDRAFADSSIFYEVGTHGLSGGTPSFRLHEPLFDNLRGDPRFETVVKRLEAQNR